MIAVMLCAGFGTRLHPLTRNTPKGLLEIAGKPILDYQMPQLLDLPELEAIHLVTNACYVAQFYEWQSRWRSELKERGISMHIHNDGSLHENERLGSVGDLAFLARKLVVHSPIVITAGDNIYRFPLRPIAETFLKSDDSLLLALREPNYQVRQRYPVFEFKNGEEIAHLHDESEQPLTEWVCPSLYFLKAQALPHVHQYLEQGGANDSLTGFLDFLISREPVRAIRKPDARVWLDVETKYMFKKANDVLGEEPLMIE